MSCWTSARFDLLVALDEPSDDHQSHLDLYSEDHEFHCNSFSSYGDILLWTKVCTNRLTDTGILAVTLIFFVLSLTIRNYFVCYKISWQCNLV